MIRKKNTLYNDLDCYLKEFGMDWTPWCETQRTIFSYQDLILKILLVGVDLG